MNKQLQGKISSNIDTVTRDFFLLTSPTLSSTARHIQPSWRGMCAFFCDGLQRVGTASLRVP